MKRKITVGGLLLGSTISFLLWFHAALIQEIAQAEVESLASAREQLAAGRLAWQRRIAAETARAREASVLAAKKEAEKPKPVAKPRPSQVLRTDIKLQTAYLAAKRANLAAAFGPLFRQLHLSPDESQKLSELILRREESVFDTASVVPRVFTAMTEFDSSTNARLVIDPYNAASYSAGRLPPESMTPSRNTQAAVTLLRRDIDTFAASATALIGSEKFSALQEYERSLALQPTVREFAGVLALASLPLEVAQADALAPALASASPSYLNGGDAIPQSIDWDKASQTLAAILTPAQLAILQHRLAHARENMHFSLELNKMDRK